MQENSELIIIRAFGMPSFVLSNATLDCARLIRSSRTDWYLQVAYVLKSLAFAYIFCAVCQSPI